MGVISIIISALAFLFSFFTYFSHDRRIKKQEEQLNKYKLAEIELEKEESKKAKVRGNIVRHNQGRRDLVIFNTGKATAKNIRVEIQGDTEGIIIREIKPFELLTPQEKFETTMHLTTAHSEQLKIKLIWDDEYQNENVFLQVLDLK